MSQDEISPEEKIKQMSRRSFVWGAVASAIGIGGWYWLKNSEKLGGIQSPFRKMFEFNEGVGQKTLSHAHLAPSYSMSDVKQDPRVNGMIGLRSPISIANWKLEVVAPNKHSIITMDEIREMTRTEMVTELMCVEGWSQIMGWGGISLESLIRSVAKTETYQYVGLETPNKEYYVGLDWMSATHPQTLLAYELNGKPLSMEHGAPLRLVIPVKYGVKNIKRIGKITLTNSRPNCYWAERGYDWFLGL